MAAGNPDLTSIAPTFITANLYHGLYQGGAFGKLTFLHWSLTSHGRRGAWVSAEQADRGYRYFPLIESHDVASTNIAFYNDWVSHPVPDDYWRALNVDHRFPEMTAPAFLTAGWYDFFIEGQLRDFEPLQPGQTALFDIHVGNTAVQFQRGHRIRVEISSSNFPRYDPNPNTGTEIATERNPVSATQRVFHRPDSASALILPAVPDSSPTDRRP